MISPENGHRGWYTVYTHIYIHSDIGKSHLAVGDRQSAWSERDGFGGRGVRERRRGSGEREEECRAVYRVRARVCFSDITLWIPVHRISTHLHRISILVDPLLLAAPVARPLTAAPTTTFGTRYLLIPVQFPPPPLQLYIYYYLAR